MNSADQQEQAEKLAETRQRISNLIVMGLRPDQDPERLALLSQLERSARAEAKLRNKGLAWLQAQIQPPLSPAPANPLTLTAPATSGSTSSAPPPT